MKNPMPLSRILSLLLALWPGYVPGVSAGTLGLLGAGPGSPVVVSGCSQATTFLARTSGLDATHQALYTGLICGMVSDGTGCSSWSAGGNLDLLYITMTQTSTVSLLNLCSSSFSLTTIGTVTFTADQGWTGDGSTGALDTNYTPSTNGVNYTLNAASAGIYLLNTRSSTGLNQNFGVVGSSNIYLGLLSSSNTAQISVNTSTASNINPASIASVKGSWGVTRTGATAEALYLNGSTTALGTDTAATSGLPSASLFILAGDLSGGVFRPTPDQAAAFYAGGALTGATYKLISDRINNFAKGLATPVNVY